MRPLAADGRNNEPQDEHVANKLRVFSESGIQSPLAGAFTSQMVYPPRAINVDQLSAKLDGIVSAVENGLAPRAFPFALFDFPSRLSVSLGFFLFLFLFPQSRQLSNRI